MERQGEEVHIETNEARGGSTPHIVRYVLIISLLLAIIAMSAIWIESTALHWSEFLASNCTKGNAW